LLRTIVLQQSLRFTQFSPKSMSRTKLRALRSIEIATHCVPGLNACIPVYRDLLGYRVVDQGRLPASLIAAWATPSMLGMPYALLQPASGADVYLRFIETGNSGGYWPPVTQGWIATELLTTDPDGVLEKLRGGCLPKQHPGRNKEGNEGEFAGSMFTHIGGPLDLYSSPKSARALQMAGPSGELMYFTRILPGGSRFGLHGAKSFVDRPFIMVVGGTSLADIEAFYGDVLGLRIWTQEPYRITQMSRVLGLPPQTAYPISLARIPGRSFLLELEELPHYIERRTVPAGQLPEGLAMVSFASASLAELRLDYRAAPCPIALPPYNGRKAAVIEGPAGEWLELIESSLRPSGALMPRAGLPLLS
jgi:catechol 2,3-dioxygenase-like lactoylglutathione lyase family enzyme